MSKETDVILVYPNTRIGRAFWGDIFMPISLLAVAAPLVNAAHKIKIIDQRVEKNWKNLLLRYLKEEPVCVGVSCMTGPQIKYALEVSKLVRENSTAPIVWGGVHPSLLPSQSLDNDFVDIVVEGEGEETFFELFQVLNNRLPLSRVKGVWYKENGELKKNPQRPFTDLNKQPPLSYQLLDIEKYEAVNYGNRYFSFLTSRGCPQKCAFCYNTSFNKGQWRFLTVEQTLERIKMIVDTYHPIGIYFTDDNLFVDVERAKNILGGIIEGGFNLQCFRLSIHAEDLPKLNEECLKLIVNSRCQALCIGIESGSQRILELIKKDIKIAEIVESNKILSRFPIRPVYSFMVGFPTETRKEISETISLIFKLLNDNKNAQVTVKFYNPYPGTDLFNLCLEHGLKTPQRLEEWIPFDYHTTNDSWLSNDRKKLLYMLCFCSLCFSPYFLKRYVKLSSFKNVWAKLKYFLIFIFLKSYRPVAKKRMMKLSCRFPIEIKLAQWFGFFRPLSKRKYAIF